MALGQLLWGLASDKFGHRNTLIAGLLVLPSPLPDSRLAQRYGNCYCCVLSSDWGVRACGDLAGNGDQALPKLSQPTAVCDHHATGGALSSTGTAIGCAAGRLLWLAQHLLTLTLMGIVLVVSTGLQTNEIAEPKTTSIAQDIKGLLKSKTYLGNVMMFACASAAFLPT